MKILSLTPLVTRRIVSALPKHMIHNELPIFSQSIRKNPVRAIELDSTSIIRILRRITKN